MRVYYHPELEAELREIKSYDNNCSLGLGDGFVDEFERFVLGIAAKPARWMIVEHDIRRALMTRFPYVIYFRCSREDTIRIMVVKHERRHLSYGLDRV